jgi:lipid-binding SYLF domain-containing protein
MRIGAPLLLTAMMLLAAGPAVGDKYDDTIKLFRNAGDSAAYFSNCYGYAVFHTVGKGAFAVIGTARGKGRVFEQGKLVGNVTLTQINVGAQLGVQAYSEIIFFQDSRAFQEFTSGNFELGANVNAVAITAGASGAAGTGTGAHAGASAGKSNAVTAGAGYHNGLAVFTIAKGGLMYQATVGGQRFKYKPR